MTTAHLLPISAREWAEAKAYFSEHPRAIKFRRKDDTHMDHSFIQVNGTIYAMAKHDYLGQGGYGKVKVVQNEQGNNFALKIERPGSKMERQIDLTILAILQRLKGAAKRKTNSKKVWTDNKPITKKEYTIQTLLTGQNLASILIKDIKGTQKITQTQKLLLAIGACRQIDKLHRLGFIHADIKPQNFMADFNGNVVVVAMMDFNLSLKAKKGKAYTDAPRGTKGFVAPEIMRDAKYSYASDVYALGVMCSKYLGLENDPLVKRMIDPDRKKRPALDEIMQHLVHELEQQPNLDQYAQDTIVAESLFVKNNRAFHNREGSVAFMRLLRDLEDLATVLTTTFDIAATQHEVLSPEHQQLKATVQLLIESVQAVRSNNLDEEMALKPQLIKDLVKDIHHLADNTQSLLEHPFIARNPILKNHIRKSIDQIQADANHLKENAKPKYKGILSYLAGSIKKFCLNIAHSLDNATPEEEKIPTFAKKYQQHREKVKHSQSGHHPSAIHAAPAKKHH